MKTSLSSLTFWIVCLAFMSCTKTQIKKNACTGDAGFLELDSCSIFFNNLFTPNGDGINENFPVYCNCPGAEEFSLSVKDGNKTLFETTNPNSDLWDGMYQGNQAKEGVYDFSFQGVIGGVSSNLEGTITLIRDISDPIKINNNSCQYILTDPIMIEG